MKPPFVSAAWLRDHVSGPELRIVDTRFALGKPDAGKSAFDAGHIPGAVFVDLERDLSAPVRPDRVGGRHPLPAAAKVEEVFSRLGISDSCYVIAYDDPSQGTGFYAAHFWWLLRYFGHDSVSVLDGGLPAWVEAGGPLETEARTYESVRFMARPRAEMVVDAAHVQSRGDGSVLVDSRTPDRYRGDSEPLDWKAGHIPGAMNLSWPGALQDGHWKSAEAQMERLKGIQDAKEIIVYCGSGVSAGANMMALELAGVRDVKLYAGSWSDWISDPSRPVATGDE